MTDMDELDEQVRQAAFGLLVRDGRPVAVGALAASLPTRRDPGPVRDAVARLAASGHLDRDRRGAVVGAGGLTLGDGPHRLVLRERAYRTWCAFDAIGIPAALGAAASVSTRCGVCGQEIALQLPVRAAAGRPERLWLAAGGTDLRAEFCTPTVLLCSSAHADAWAARQQGRGQALDLAEASRIGAAEWAAYARETARLGAA